MAVVSSLRSFDREQQKEYEVPIVIKDSGNPSMSGNIFLKKNLVKFSIGNYFTKFNKKIYFRHFNFDHSHWGFQ